jgi:hypothetical protein
MIMNTKILFSVAIFLAYAVSFGISTPTLPFQSKYTGQEKREIKSFSEDDLDQLRNGKGWGLAKAAELNGLPGPIHLLEMKQEIDLTQAQVSRIEELYLNMKNKAIPLGLELIALEKELDRAFADGTINDETLKEILGKIGRTLTQLRYVHLAAHLKTPAVLTTKQKVLYNKLRGYTSGNSQGGMMKDHDKHHPKSGH